MIGFALLAITIGLGFLALGAWLVLPFAGLEAAVFAAAVAVLARHADDWERVTVHDTEVVVTVREAGRDRRHVFTRGWARVWITRDADRHAASRLWIGSHGCSVAIAQAVTEDERRRLAAEIGDALRVATNARADGIG